MLNIRDKKKTAWATFVLSIVLAPDPGKKPEIYLPIRVLDRASLAELRLTNIGGFGLLRKARPGISSHLHAGIDIRRPSDNYLDEPIYPIAEGRVISKREDGPYAQLILEHQREKEMFWTVYEHISRIRAEVGEWVGPEDVIARFMNKEELDRYGWQFDHFHLEILKREPVPLLPSKNLTQRFYRSYSLECHSQAELKKYFHDPLAFFQDSWKHRISP